MRLLRRRRPSSWIGRRPSTHPVAVECRGLRKAYGDVVAVSDVHLDVVRGEILALLGPSGCGKTTFLRVIAGFERPDAGTICLAGRPVAGKGAFVPPERRRVGVVFQDYALFPHMCVGDNVGFGLRGADCDVRVREVVELVGLGGLIDRFPHELSGGEQQRVALARAMAPRPDLILLDEPFSNLDATLRQRLRTEVRDILHHAETTAIFVTHDQEEALSLADRIAIMAAGRIHQVASPELIYTRPDDTFVAAFVGGANLIRGTGDGHEVESPLGTFRPLNEPPEGEVLLVVRPESLQIRSHPSGQAVVAATTYYGHDQMIEVRLASQELVRVRIGPGRFYEPGDHVTISVVGDEVIAFPS